MARPPSLSRYDELSLRVIHDPNAPLLTREWLRLVRERQGLRQMDVVARLVALGPYAALTRGQLSRLESGKLSLSALGFFQTEGLRQVFNISQTAWDERMRLAAVPVQRRGPA